MSYVIRKAISKNTFYLKSTCIFQHQPHFPFNNQISVTSYFLSPRKFSWNGFYTSLSHSAPVTTLQSVLIDVHQMSGLPWWSIILLTTLGIRSLIVLPLTIQQYQVISRLANVNAKIAKIAPELNKEVNIARRQFNWTEGQAKKVFRRQLKKIHDGYVVQDNCHPFKGALLVLIQIPVWVCFSVSLRNLTYASNAFHPGVESLDLNFKNEGLLWFSDLTAADPIFIPILLMLVNFSLIEIHAIKNIGERTLLQKVLLNGSRLITIAVAAAATINPASVTFYWLCSSTFGIGQALLLVTPRVRRALNIPKTGKESLTPFADIVKDFTKRFKR